MTFARNCVELGILNVIGSLKQQNTKLYTEYKIKITYVWIFAYMCADYETRTVIMSMLKKSQCEDAEKVIDTGDMKGEWMAV